MAPVTFEGSPFKPLQEGHVGVLYERRNDNNLSRHINVFAAQELFIGRDKKTCHLVVDTRSVSNKHIRIYSVVFESDGDKNIAPLVYAETLSPNGAWWNGRFINKVDPPVLLSDGDRISVSKFDSFLFKCENAKTKPLSDVQWKEIALFAKEYEIRDRLLGEGAYGRVHMALERVKGKQMVCKMVDISKVRRKLQRFDQLGVTSVGDIQDIHQAVKCTNQGDERKNLVESVTTKLRSYDREFQILQGLCHPNIIGIEKVFKTDNTIYIFQELVTGGDLFSFLERKGGMLLEVEAAVIVRQIVLALDYLHDNNIAHRDLKPDNVLLSSLATGTRVLLTDFGCARDFSADSTRMHSFMGTYEYTAPEIARDSRNFPSSKGYTQSVDLWSLGCLTGVLLTGLSPFFDPHTNQFSELLAQQPCLYQSETDPDWLRLGERAKDFVRRLLVPSEGMRMTAKEALTHGWFTNKAHKREFEAVYERALKRWRPRPAEGPIACDWSTNVGDVTRRSPEWPLIHQSSSAESSMAGPNDKGQEAELFNPSPPVTEEGKRMSNATATDASKPKGGMHLTEKTSRAIGDIVMPRAEVSAEYMPLATRCGNVRISGVPGDNVRPHLIDKGQTPGEGQNAGLCSPAYPEREHDNNKNDHRARHPFSPGAWNAGTELSRQVVLKQTSAFFTGISTAQGEESVKSDPRRPQQAPAAADSVKETSTRQSHSNSIARDVGRRPGFKVGDERRLFNGLGIRQESPLRREMTENGKRETPEWSEDEDKVFEETEDVVTGRKVKVAYASRF